MASFISKIGLKHDVKFKETTWIVISIASLVSVAIIADSIFPSKMCKLVLNFNNFDHYCPALCDNGSHGSYLNSF